VAKHASSHVTDMLVIDKIYNESLQGKYPMQQTQNHCEQQNLN